MHQLFAVILKQDIHITDVTCRGTRTAIKASDDSGYTFMRYSENNIPAGIVSDRYGYRTVVMGFPLEVMTDKAQRNHLMQSILNYFNK